MKLLLLTTLLTVLYGPLRADALDATVAQTQNSDPSVRIDGFESLKAYLSATPVDPRAINATIALLYFETQQKDAADDDADYYSELIATTASLNTPSAIPALVQVIGTGNLVPKALAKFGSQSLDQVLSRANDSDWLVRKCVMISLIAMLQPANLPLVNDPASLNKISTALHNGAIDSSQYVIETAMAGLQSLQTINPVLGDVNGDGKVDCTDIGIIKAALGKKTGQAGFDFRADLNKDGVIDIRDLAIVSKQLPAGTHCQ